MSGSPSPAGPTPRVAEELLRALLDDAAREAVLGDLQEGFLAIRQQRGDAVARWWYWRQAVRSVIACRITGRRDGDARRYDFDQGARVSLRDLLRPALRQFRDQPLYAAACAGTLALAVGAACVSIAVVKRAFIDPLPYRDSHALVSLLTMVDGMTSAVSPHVLQDLRASAPPLIEFAPIRPAAAAYSTANATESLGISFVDRDYFAMLGVSPALGRIWTDSEPDAVVVSSVFWRDRLAQAGNVIGRSIVLDGRPRTIVGVLPAGFMPPYFFATEIWAPIEMTALLADIRTRRTLTILARRSPGTSARDLDTYLTLFSQQIQQRFPQMHGGQTWVARSLRQELVGAATPALIGTAAAGILLLVIVAANIAGLSTAQAAHARHDMAVRAALGATRGRLFAEQVIENVVLGLAGSLAGLWIAYGLIHVIGRYQQFFLPRLAPITLDLSAGAIAVLAGVLIGLVAALLPRGLVSVASSDALRSARGSTGDIKVTRARSALVIAQVAIALVLLVGTGLLIRTVLHLSQRDLGFDRDGLTWFQVNLPGRQYQDTEPQLQFERQALDRLGQIPGVTSAMASVGFPLWGGMMAGLGIKGDAPGTPRREVAYLSVSPDFIADVGARIVSGRALLPTDTLNAPRVVVINETMARMFWPQGDAIGAEVQIGPGSLNERWITVVGIMADMRAHGVAEPIRPTAFGSTLQYSWPRRHLAVRTAGAMPVTLAAELRAAIQAVDPAVAIGTITSAEQTLTNSMARHRLVMFALAVFGSVAVILCISGLYAVIALDAQRRRREYAIRVALGARQGVVRWMVTRQALVLAGAGALVGLATAAFGTRAIQGLLHGVQPVDPITFAAAGAALLVLATLAASVPASQAEKVNPVDALRED